MNDMRNVSRQPQRVSSRDTQTVVQPLAAPVRASRAALFSKIAGLVVVVGLLIGAAYWVMPKGQAIDENGYQVVYLTSGQAYFGKLKNTTGEYLVIQTPYTAQDVKAASSESQTDSSSSPQTTLIKVSNQLYGPTDSIAIRSNQVAFWQNLRDDSKVVQAIKSKQ